MSGGACSLSLSLPHPSRDILFLYVCIGWGGFLFLSRSITVDLWIFFKKVLFWHRKKVLELPFCKTFPLASPVPKKGVETAVNKRFSLPHFILSPLGFYFFNELDISDVVCLSGLQQFEKSVLIMFSFELRHSQWLSNTSAVGEHFILSTPAFKLGTKFGGKKNGSYLQVRNICWFVDFKKSCSIPFPNHVWLKTRLK